MLKDHYYTLNIILIYQYINSKHENNLSVCVYMYICIHFLWKKKTLWFFILHHCINWKRITI